MAITLSRRSAACRRTPLQCTPKRAGFVAFDITYFRSAQRADALAGIHDSITLQAILLPVSLLAEMGFVSAELFASAATDDILL